MVLNITGFRQLLNRNLIYAKKRLKVHIIAGAMESIKKEIGGEFCRRCEYCQPCPSGVAIAQGMIYPLLASRMSPEVASEFASRGMETIPECTECGLCMKKCPYSLPITTMLKKHYALYKSHRSGKEGV